MKRWGFLTIAAVLTAASGASAADANSGQAEEIDFTEVWATILKAHARCERDLRNLRIVARIQRYEPGKADGQWVKSPACSKTRSWYERRRDARVRIDYDSQKLQPTFGAAPQAESRYVIVHDGSQFRKIDFLHDGKTTANQPSITENQEHCNQRHIAGAARDTGIAYVSEPRESYPAGGLLSFENGFAWWMLPFVQPRESSFPIRAARTAGEGSALVTLVQRQMAFAHTVVLDPHKGYSLARYERWTDGKRTFLYRVDAWKQLTPDLWFPVRWTVHCPGARNGRRLDYEAFEVGFFDPARSPDIFGLKDVDLSKAVVERPEQPAALPAEKARALIEPLKTRGMTSKRTGELVAKAAAAGDAIIEPLMAEFRARATLSVFRHNVILVLGRIATPAARRALLEIADMDSPTANSVYAAGVLFATSEDYADTACRQDLQLLLDCLKPAVQCVALERGGFPLDDRHHKMLLAMAESVQPKVRWAALRRLGQSRGPERLQAGLEAMIRSLQTAEKVEPPASISMHVMRMPAGQSYADRTMQLAIDSLLWGRWSNETLARTQERLSGAARDAVVIARALRGEKNAHKDVMQILQRPQEDWTKVRALEALRAMGSLADVPKLQKIARTAKWKVRTGTNLDGSPNLSYPVRRAAESAIRWLSKAPRAATRPASENPVK